MTVFFSTYHRGRYGFRICRIDGTSVAAETAQLTEACLEANVLKQAAGQQNPGDRWSVFAFVARPRARRLNAPRRSHRAAPPTAPLRSPPALPAGITTTTGITSASTRTRAARATTRPSSSSRRASPATA